MAAWLILHNPKSRLGRRALPQVVEGIAAGAGRGVAVSTAVIGELDRLAEVPDRIVAVGGDGTVNAAASWLDSRGASCPIAILPTGTGNNLARGLGVPLGLQSALRVATRGRNVFPIDVVSYRTAQRDRGRLMVQSSALGFPAAMAARYDALRRWSVLRPLFRPFGTYVYRALGLLGLAGQRARELRRKDLLDVEIDLPGEQIRETAFAVFIGNEKSIGGNFYPCPLARIDDGLIDVCIVRTGTGESYLKVFREILRGGHLTLTRTILYRQTAGPLTVRLSAPSPYLVDGDLWVRSERYHIEVRPRVLHVVGGDGRG